MTLAFSSPRRIVGVMILLLASLSSAPSHAQAPCRSLIASGNPEYPPYLWQDPANPKRLIGAAADLLQQLALEIGTPIELRYAGPWARVQESARNGRIDLVAGAFYTLPRRQYMSYVQPPMLITSTAVWMRDSKPFAYNRWADLIDREGVTVVNNSFGEEFDRFAEHNLLIQPVGSVESALKMLSLGRADYAIYEDAPAWAYATKLGIRNLRTAEQAISREPLYLTMAHQSACFNDALYQRLSAAMRKLIDSNVVTDLVAKNQQRWQMQKR